MVDVSVDNVREMAAYLELLQEDENTFPTGEFNAAAEALKSMTGLKDSQRLVMYGLYKQAITGNINIDRPWSINMTDAAKWVTRILLE